MRFWIGLLFLFIINSCHLNSKEKAGGNFSLISRLDSIILNSDFNGVIVLSKDTSLLYSKVMGFSDIEKERKILATDQFVIGSISKQITAILVLRELEKGRLKLEDKISKHLEGLDQTWRDEVTIHHLLTHTHGIQGLDQALSFQAGSQFEYSQLGYELLAQILESVSDKTFVELSMELFTSYELNSCYHPDIGEYEDLVKGYIEEDNGQLEYAENSLSNYAAAGSFISNANDLIKWNYLLHTNRLIDSSTLRLMKTRYSTREHPIFDQVEYGYGLLFMKGESDVEIGALGYAPGFVSASYYYPQSSLNLVVLSNTAKHLTDFRKTFGVHLKLMEEIKLKNAQQNLPDNAR